MAPGVTASGGEKATLADHLIFSGAATFGVTNSCQPLFQNVIISGPSSWVSGPSWVLQKCLQLSSPSVSNVLGTLCDEACFQTIRV